MTEIPYEVCELEWLESLTMATNWFEWDEQEWRDKFSRNGGARNNLDDVGPLFYLRAELTACPPLRGWNDRSSISLFHRKISMPVATQSPSQSQLRQAHC